METNNEKSTKKRTWIARYNKYLDELTPEEWEDMTNQTCGVDCDVPQ